MLSVCLAPESRAYAAFMCAICQGAWAGILEIDGELTDSDLLTFAACPVHGKGQLKVNLLDGRRKRRPTREQR